MGGDDRILGLRRRVTELVEAYLGGELSWTEFMEAVPEDVDDDAVAEVIDLIQHEPSRRGLWGGTNRAYAAHERAVRLALRALAERRSSHDRFKYVRWEPAGTEPGRSPREDLCLRVLQRLLRFMAANPDLEHLHARVVYWWVEVADPSGLPEREIGFDGEGQPIVLGPVGRNTGFVVDSPMTFEDAPDAEEVRANFERVWAMLEERDDLG